MIGPEALHAYERFLTGRCPCCGRYRAAEHCKLCDTEALTIGHTPDGEPVIICGHCAAHEPIDGHDAAAYLVDGIQRGRQLAAGLVARL